MKTRLYLLGVKKKNFAKRGVWRHSRGIKPKKGKAPIDIGLTCLRGKGAKGHWDSLMGGDEVSKRIAGGGKEPPRKGVLDRREGSFPPSLEAYRKIGRRRLAKIVRRKKEKKNPGS